MPSSRSGLSPRAFGWALLSQVFWLPLVAIDLHDRWLAHQRDITPPGRELPASPIARARPFSLNELLGAARPVQQLAGRANQAVSGALGQAVSGAGVLLSSAGSGVSSLLDRPFSASVDAPPAHQPGSAAPGARSLLGDAPGSGPLGSSTDAGLLSRHFSRAQLLGGSLALADLGEGPMAPLALAERAVQRGSGDPLAPLPQLWREPMRQALLRLPGAPQQLSTARLVHVPSSRVSQPVEVPLALQSDGSVDILQAPDNPAVLREIEGWSRQQRLPATGSLQPALVHLHPLNAEAPASPAAPSAVRAPSVSPAAASRLTPAPAPFSPSQPQVQPSEARPTAAQPATPRIPVAAPAAAAPAPAAPAPAARVQASPESARVPADLLPPPPLPPLAEASPAPAVEAAPAAAAAAP